MCALLVGWFVSQSVNYLVAPLVTIQRLKVMSNFIPDTRFSCSPNLLLTLQLTFIYLIFLFSTASRTALGPTQPHIQWVPGALSLGVKRPEHEAYHSPPSSAEVKECL
jgi:hypothetical protein